MGLETTCVVRIGRAKSEGKALLETKEIIFRGEPRLKIPFTSIQELNVRGEWLEVVHDGGRVAFELGATAAVKWRDRIRKPKGLLDKLGVKEGQNVVVLGIDEPAFAKELKARGVTVGSKLKRETDLVFLGLASQADLKRLAAARNSIAPAGGVWAVWPKGRPALTEDHVRAEAKKAGLVDIKVAAFSDTLSALKLVIPKASR
jgi:hypothetical protein